MEDSHQVTGALHRFICPILLHLNSTLSSAAHMLWACRVSFSTVALVGAQQASRNPLAHTFLSCTVFVADQLAEVTSLHCCWLYCLLKKTKKTPKIFFIVNLFYQVSSCDLIITYNHILMCEEGKFNFLHESGCCTHKTWEWQYLTLKEIHVLET